MQRIVVVNRIVLLVFVVACGLALVEAQTCLPRPEPRKRGLCGSTNSPSPVGCLNYTNCCHDPVTSPHCYAQTVIANGGTKVAAAKRTLPVVDRPPNLQPVVERAASLGATLDQTTSSNIQERAINFNIATLIDFPACPVNVPFCHRVACATNMPDAETNPLSCYTDSRCCFDRDLYFYKIIFGPNYMGNAPVCFFGPTSSTYISIANSIQPWNPFFQQAVVNIFEQVLDTFFNYQQTTICLVTQLLSATFLRNHKCGWQGITKLECSLKGCCYTDADECVYPRDIPSLFPNSNIELYPELNTRDPAETTCRPLNDFSFDPRMYRRLPCSCPDPAIEETVGTIRATCPLPSPLSSGCCPNYLALFPQIADLSAITSGVVPTINPLLPFLIGGTLPSASSLALFYCPYFFVPVIGLPPLLDRTIGCCKQHSCYHKKRLIATWGSWSTWACNAPCGPGTATRSRTCLTGSGCSGSGVESRPCTAGPCSFWGNWGPYGSCSTTCGNSGIRTSSRSCIGSSGINCPGSSIRQVPCNRIVCATWSLWQPWGSCSRPCGSQGIKTRRRFCRTTQGQSSTVCSGSGTQTDLCNRFSCGSWGNWVDQGTCSGTCGTTGSLTRSRECLRNGQPTTGCPGARTFQVSCTNAPCTWGAWGPWDACDASCSRSRTRTCPGQCPPPPPFQTEPCIDGACSLDPAPDSIVWGDWSTWTECNAACDGQRFQFRRCIYNGQANSFAPNQACQCSLGGTNLKTEPCQGNACTAAWGQWNSWSDCSCGSGQVRTRTRACILNGSTTDNSLCPGSASSSEACNSGPCPTNPTQSWTSWTQWSSCLCSQQGATQVRVRCLGSFQNCSGNRLQPERRSCSNPDC